MGMGMALSMKPLFKRPRPYDALDGIQPNLPLPDRWSMPSGHTSTAFSAAVSISLAYPRWEVVCPSLLWAGAVGASRIFLGHHYPGDVLAGAVLGSGFAWISHYLSQKVKRKKIRLPFRKPDPK
jgi:undecaprenyl-diphosphatase